MGNLEVIMKQYSATLWRNMNMSCPYEIAEKLGLKPGEKVIFVDHGDRITVEKEVNGCGQTA